MTNPRLVHAMRTDFERFLPPTSASKVGHVPDEARTSTQPAEQGGNMARRKVRLPYEPMYKPKLPRREGQGRGFWRTLLRFCTLGLIGRRREEQEETRPR